MAKSNPGGWVHSEYAFGERLSGFVKWRFPLISLGLIVFTLLGSAGGLKLTVFAVLLALFFLVLALLVWFVVDVLWIHPSFARLFPYLRTAMTAMAVVMIAVYSVPAAWIYGGIFLILALAGPALKAHADIPLEDPEGASAFRVERPQPSASMTAEALRRKRFEGALSSTLSSAEREADRLT